MPTEADTCRKLVVPKVQAAGWVNQPHSIAGKAGKPGADPFDLLCPLVLNGSVLHRRQLIDWMNLENYMTTTPQSARFLLNCFAVGFSASSVTAFPTDWTAETDMRELRRTLGNDWFLVTVHSLGAQRLEKLIEIN